MARTKQTARKKQPDPVPDGAAARPGIRPLNASFKERKLSKDWSETLNERHPHQNVNLADLLYFKKGDYVNVYSLPDEQGCRYAYTVYFDKMREGVYYGFIRGRKTEYVHFNLIYVQSLTRVPEPCA